MQQTCPPLEFYDQTLWNKYTFTAKNMETQTWIFVKFCFKKCLKEIQFYKQLTNLVTSNICENLPIFLFWSSSCLFPINFSSNKIVPDSVFYAANSKSGISKYHLQHWSIIYQLFPLSNNNNIQKFIEQTKFSYLMFFKFINFQPYYDQKINASCLFELLYTQICLIRFQNFIINVPQDLAIRPKSSPRIYKIGSNYFLLSSSSQIYFYQFTHIQPFPYTNQRISPIQLLLPLHYHSNLQPTLEILSNLSTTLDNFTLEYLPKLFSKFLISPEQAFDLQYTNVPLYSF